MTASPSLVEFEDECCSFFNAQGCQPRRPHEPFAWGRGSDVVSLFEEFDPTEEAASLLALRRWRRSLWDADLGWITGPEELGGRGLTAEHQRVFDRAGAAYDLPNTGKLIVSLGVVAPTILQFGTRETHLRCLPGLWSGRLIGCQLFSEPGAGSDLAGLATQAVADGDSWKITGQKVWTSGAHYADVGLAICRTSTGPRHRNLTAFVVDMHDAGVQVRPLRQMTGGAAFNEVFLSDVNVDDADRVGAVGGGWDVARAALAYERAAIGGGQFGGSGVLSTERLIQLSRAFGVDNDPLHRQSLAQLLIQLRVAKMMTRHLQGRRNTTSKGVEGSLSKLALAANLQRLAQHVSGVVGAALQADTGRWGSYAWSTLVLGAPGWRIGAGSDEILKNVVAERMLGLPRDP